MAPSSSNEESPSEGTYIFDSENAGEMARLINQGQLLTRVMGGPLAHIDKADITQWHSVLDLGCGPGDWALDVSFEHPTIKVTGVDISRIMVNYANARARSQHIANVSFSVMDITPPLDFPTESFDMINARYLFGVLRREEWPPFIQECMRILRPGGILRLTEPLDLGLSSSPALERLSSCFFQLLRQGNYCFSADGNTVGLAHKLPRMLREAGYRNIEQIGHSLDFSGDTPDWPELYHDLEVIFHTAQPLFVKAGIVTQQEAAELYQRMLIELHADDFCAVWHYTSIQGKKLP